MPHRRRPRAIVPLSTLRAPSSLSSDTTTLVSTETSDERRCTTCGDDFVLTKGQRKYESTRPAGTIKNCEACHLKYRLCRLGVPVGPTEAPVPAPPPAARARARAAAAGGTSAAGGSRGASARGAAPTGAPTAGGAHYSGHRGRHGRDRAPRAPGGAAHGPSGGVADALTELAAGLGASTDVELRLGSPPTMWVCNNAANGGWW